jgi:hypothetical protein
MGADGQLDRRTGMTEIRGAFCVYAKAPEKHTKRKSRKYA